MEGILMTFGTVLGTIAFCMLCACLPSKKKSKKVQKRSVDEQSVDSSTDRVIKKEPPKKVVQTGIRQEETVFVKSKQNKEKRIDCKAFPLGCPDCPKKQLCDLVEKSKRK